MNLSRNILYGLGAVALAALVWYFGDIVAYLLIAWVLSMLGRPLVVFFKRRIRIGKFRAGDSVAALLTIVVFYLVILGLLFMFVPTIVEQARHLADVDYQAIGEKLRGPFAYLDTQAHQLGFLKQTESLATKTQELLSNWFRPALVGDFVGSFISSAGSFLVAMTAVTFILFFFLQENGLFLSILHAIVPNQIESKVRHAVQESSGMLTRYFRGILIQTGAFAFLIFTILSLLGVPNALLIGAFGGLLNIVPYLGPIIGLLFGCFITISSHLEVDFAQLWPLLLKVVITFNVVQVLDNMLISTIIYSKSVQAHPLEIFIVTLIAAKIGGVAGMVLGIPVFTVLRVIAKTFFSEFKVVQRMTEHLEDDPEPEGVKVPERI